MNNYIIVTIVWPNPDFDENCYIFYLLTQNDIFYIYNLTNLYSWKAMYTIVTIV